MGAAELGKSADISNCHVPADRVGMEESGKIMRFPFLSLAMAVVASFSTPLLAEERGVAEEAIPVTSKLTVREVEVKRLQWLERKIIPQCTALVVGQSWENDATRMIREGLPMIIPSCADIGKRRELIALGGRLLERKCDDPLVSLIHAS